MFSTGFEAEWLFFENVNVTVVTLWLMTLPLRVPVPDVYGLVVAGNVDPRFRVEELLTDKAVN